MDGIKEGLKLKFEDTNIALLGTIFEKKLRLERAEAEPEWKKIKKEPGLMIWRIEKFNVVPWPKEQYGTFYQGDSYIILNITQPTDHLEFRAHMWVGKESTCDETGTAAYKIVELDDYFDRKVTLIYEAQDYESKLFLSYFKTIIILEGGIDTGFKPVQPDEYRTRLLHVRGIGSCVHSSEVPLSVNSLNNEDVFIIDDGLTIYNWRGEKSTGFEKFHGMTICEKLRKDRFGKPTIISIEQGEKNEQLKKFFEDLSSEKLGEKKGVPSDMIIGCHKKMMRLSDANGVLEMKEVPYDKSQLKSDDTFLIDRGDNIFVWVGKNASNNEKRYGFVFAKKYQDLEKRNTHLPIIALEEGQLKEEIEMCFK